MNKAKDILKKQTMLLALVFIMVLFQVLIVSQGKGSLFAPTNITNLISQNSYVVVLATGMLICILTGGNIDLSVGSSVALVGALAGTLIVNMKVNVYVSIFLCLVAGTLLGAWQAYWIAYKRIPSFIVTLAGMLVYRGLALTLLDGQTISPFPATFTNIFNSYIPGRDADPALRMAISLGVAAVLCIIIAAMTIITRANRVKKNYEVESLVSTTMKTVLACTVLTAVFWLFSQDKGVPVILILLTVVVLAYHYYTSNTVSGRHLYAMGGNEKAAKLSGINTNRTLFFAYANMGFLAAVAALVAVARFNSAAPSAGTNYEMDAIAACYIGGASSFGGVGTVPGAVIGAIFMGVLNNGMSILGIDSNWQRTVKGLVLLTAVILDVLNKKRKQSS